MNPEAMSPLRRRRTEDTTICQFGAHTQRDYIRQVRDFTAFLARSPARAEPEDLRRYPVAPLLAGRQLRSHEPGQFFFHVAYGCGLCISEIAHLK